MGCGAGTANGSRASGEDSPYIHVTNLTTNSPSPSHFAGAEVLCVDEATQAQGRPDHPGAVTLDTPLRSRAPSSPNSALRPHSNLRTPKIHYRGYLARRYCSVLYVTENLAIIKLQASVRGFLGRKAVALWHARLVRGAIKIQSFTRGCLSRKNSYEENP